jgi:hypothetical protein
MLGDHGVRWAIRRKGFVIRPRSVGTARRRGSGRSSRCRCHSRSHLWRHSLWRRGERPGLPREAEAMKVAVAVAVNVRSTILHPLALDVRRQRCRRRQ